MIAIDKSIADYFYRTPIYSQTAADARPVLYKPANTRMEDLGVTENRYPPLLCIIGDDQEPGMFELRSKVGLKLQQDIASNDPGLIKQSLARVLNLAMSNPNKSGAEAAAGAAEFLVYEYGNNKQILDKLVQVAIKNHTTALHSVNVLALALRYAFHNKLPADECRRLALAALLHDIGVADLEQEVMQAPAPLEDDMFLRYREHTRKGYRLLESCGVPVDIRDAALHHHERCDGSGYPDGIADVPDFAQVIGLIHDFEALVYFDRPWRPALKPIEALKRLKRETLSGRFEPSIFERFMRCLVRTA